MHRIYRIKCKGWMYKINKKENKVQTQNSALTLPYVCRDGVRGRNNAGSKNGRGIRLDRDQFFWHLEGCFTAYAHTVHPYQAKQTDIMLRPARTCEVEALNRYSFMIR